MDFRYDLVTVLPVSDVDRLKEFYAGRLRLVGGHRLRGRAGIPRGPADAAGVRVLDLDRHGDLSSASPSSFPRTHLVVSDIEAAKV